jgi:hypothetical protein
MPPVGFEPTISAGERPQTYALDRAGIDTLTYVINDKTVLLVILQFFIIPYYPNSEPWIS